MSSLASKGGPTFHNAGHAYASLRFSGTLSSAGRLRSYSYFSKASTMRQRHEALRLNRIFNFFASIALVLFILLLIGLVEMRINSVQSVGQGFDKKTKNPLRVGWQTVSHIPVALAAAQLQYGAKINPPIQTT